MCLFQYRIMEGDRNAYSRAVASRITIQRNAIKQLRKEHNKIAVNVKVASTDQKKRLDTSLNKHIESLLEEHEKTEQKIKTDKAHITELDFQIKKLEKELVHVKYKTITDVQSQSKMNKGQKIIQNLENLLEVAVRKFNCVVTANFNLRMEIDHILKER